MTGLANRIMPSQRRRKGPNDIMGDFKIVRKFVTEKPIYKKKRQKLDKFTFSKD